MNDLTKYTIEFPPAPLIAGGLKNGDWIDIATMSPIVGPYCMWPKTEPRYFQVSYDFPTRT